MKMEQAEKRYSSLEKKIHRQRCDTLNVDEWINNRHEGLKLRAVAEVSPHLAPIQNEMVYEPKGSLTEGCPV